MIEWITTVITAIQSNPIVAGIFGTTVFAGIATYFRRLPKTILFKIRDFFTIGIQFDQQMKIESSSVVMMPVQGFKINQAYNAIIQKLANIKIYSFSRTFECIAITPENESITNSLYRTQELKFIGSINKTYWGFLSGVLISFRISQNDHQYTRSFNIALRFYTMNKKKVQKILDQIFQEELIRSGRSEKIEYNFNQGSFWNTAYRDLAFSQNIFMLNKKQEDIYQKVGRFLNSQDKYRKLCKPYHTGFLLYGEPGCGKSQFIKKMAEDFQIPIHILNLNSVGDDTALIELFQTQNRSTSIFLFEDVDRIAFTGEDTPENEEPEENSSSPGTTEDQRSRMNFDQFIKTLERSPHRVIPFARRKPIIKSKVSFSAVLNVIDGIYSDNCGRIFIATTNHIEQLDPAFCRPGRFDYKYYFTYMTSQEICNFIHIQYNSNKPVHLRKDLHLPISIVSNVCFECDTIEECSQKLNQL